MDFFEGAVGVKTALQGNNGDNAGYVAELGSLGVSWFMALGSWFVFIGTRNWEFGIGCSWFVARGSCSSELGTRNWLLGIGTGNAFTLATICMVGTRVPRVRIPRQPASDCGHAGLVAPRLLREAPVKQSFAPFDVLAPFARAITRMPRPTRAAKAPTVSRI